MNVKEIIWIIIFIAALTKHSLFIIGQIEVIKKTDKEHEGMVKNKFTIKSFLFMVFINAIFIIPILFLFSPKNPDFVTERITTSIFYFSSSFLWVRGIIGYYDSAYHAWYKGKIRKIENMEFKKNELILKFEGQKQEDKISVNNDYDKLLRKYYSNNSFKENITQDEFDERQKLIFGKGFTIGFFVLLVCDWIFAVLKDAGIFSFEQSFSAWLCSTFIALGFIMTHLIWHDADITPKRERISPNARYVTTIFLGIVLIATGVSLIITDGYSEFSLIFLGSGLFLIYLAVNHFVKKAWDKKHRKTSEGEE